MASLGEARIRESAFASLADTTTLESPNSNWEYGSRVVGTTALYENGQIRLIPVRPLLVIPFSTVALSATKKDKAPSPDPSGQYQLDALELPAWGDNV